MEECPPTEIQRLTAEMVRGEDAAYHEFFGRYFDRLLRYLTVAARGDEESAHEALQSAMIHVSRRMRIFPTEDDLWRWLCAVARNALVDEQRKRGRRQSLWTRFLRESTEPISPRADDGDPEAVLLAGLHRTLQELAPDDRQLLSRKYYEREPVRSIAAALGTTEKAIESRLTRLRRKLKQALLHHLRHETSA